MESLKSHGKGHGISKAHKCRKPVEYICNLHCDNCLLSFMLCRDLPRALMIGIPLVTIVYLLTNIAYIAVVGGHGILTSGAVAMVSQSFSKIGQKACVWTKVNTAKCLYTCRDLLLHVGLQPLHNLPTHLFVADPEFFVRQGPENFSGPLDLKVRWVPKRFYPPLDLRLGLKLYVIYCLCEVNLLCAGCWRGKDGPCCMVDSHFCRMLNLWLCEWPGLQWC